MAKDLWKKYAYIVVKRFFLRGTNGSWKIARKSKCNSEGGYKVGKKYFDYEGHGLKIAPLTYELIKRGFIKELI